MQQNNVIQEETTNLLRLNLPVDSYGYKKVLFCVVHLQPENAEKLVFIQHKLLFIVKYHY